MKRLAFIFVLLCALPVWAGVTFVDKCSGTTSCTVPAHLPGDLMIAVAGRDASATAPTLPSGWTSPAGTACLAGAGTCTINGTSTADSAVRIAYKIANGTTGTNDTATGFTNSGALTVVIYRSTNVIGTNAGIAQIVWTATSINTTSTTETFATVTNAASTSWNVGFGYAPAATAGIGTAPAGMTNRNAQGTVEGSHDTNGAVSSFSTANVTLTTAGRIITAVLELQPAGTLAACTGAPCPTLVQHVAWGTNGDAHSASVFKFHLPNPTLASNLLICGVSWDTAATATITDNNSSTWVDGPTSNNGTRKIMLKYVLGVAAGTQDLTLTLSAVEFNVHFECSEFYNVATSSAVDGTATSASGIARPVIAAGSITTTTNNDLIYYYGINDTSLGATNAINAWQVGNSFNLLNAERHVGHAAQYAVWGSSGAINPTMMAYQTTADTFGAAAIAFKAATAGTAPSAGIRIVHVIHSSMNAAAYTIQFPASGNLIVSSTAQMKVDQSITSITDTDSNTYTVVSTPNNNYSQMYYAASATVTNPNTRTMTINNANTGVTGILVIYDITGAATSPYDTSGSTADATQTAAGGANCPGVAGSDTTHAPDITPTTSNGLVIAMQNTGIGPVCNISGAGFVFDSGWYSGQDDSSTGLWDTSDGYGHYYNSGTSALNFTWNWANATTSGGAALAAAFKAPAASGVRKRVIVTSE